MNRRTPGLSFVFLILLLDTLGFGLLIPVGPRLIEQLAHCGDGEAARLASYLVSTYAVMQFLCSPLLGALSDRFGRRPVLLVSMFGSALDYFAMAMVPDVSWFFITRAINGLSGASITTASAYIADVTPPEKRAAGFGVIGAAFGLGFVLGPLLGGVLGEWSLRAPFWAAGAVTMANWLYGLLIVPESLPPEHRKHTPLLRNPLRSVGALFRYPIAWRLAGALFLLNSAQFALHATWVLYTGRRYQWGPRMVGFSLFAVGIGAAIVQGGLARRIVPKLGERKALLTGIGIGALAFLGYGSATEGWMIYCVIAIASLGGIAMPACQSLITRNVRPDEQGAVQGGLTSCQSLAQIAGPLAGGAVFAWSIALSPELPGAVFFMGAGLSLVGWAIAVWALRQPHLEGQPGGAAPRPPA